MKKYIVIYHAPATLMEQVKKTTAEEAKENMKPWMEWAEKCGDGLVDMGTPLGNSQKVTSEGTKPGDKDIIGYSILQAENLDDAVGMVKDHPHLKWDSSCDIEVHEALPLPN